MSSVVVQDLQFTQDWNSGHMDQVWAKILPQCMDSRKTILELGSFEGRSACWFLEHLLDADGALYCLDTWEGSPEFQHDRTIDMVEVSQRFRANITVARKPHQSVHAIRKTTVAGLAELISSKNRPDCDLIYIDASHNAADVLTDACMSWQLLKIGGLMMFDDYAFGFDYPLHFRPKFAIDAFMSIYSDRLHIIIIGPQVIVKKLKD